MRAGAAQRSIVVALALIFSACTRRPALIPATFEMADVVTAGTPGALRLPNWEARDFVHVANLRAFDIVEASVQPDSFGAPGIAFRLDPSEEAAFRAWTGSRSGKTAAMVVDRRVATVATVHGPLPGAGMIEFGMSVPIIADLGELAERLAADP